jgi:hypothetical protein
MIARLEKRLERSARRSQEGTKNVSRGQNESGGTDDHTTAPVSSCGDDYDSRKRSLGNFG